MKGKHHTRRNARITRLASEQGVPSSTIVGRGLHRKAPQPCPSQQTPYNLTALPIAALDFGNDGAKARISLALEREGYVTVGDIAGLNVEELLDVRNFGRESLTRLVMALYKVGITLKSGKAQRAPATR